MGKYLITGNAGTGKSTIIEVLAQRGYNAFDIDERPDIHGYLDTQTNTVIDSLPAMGIKGAEAFARYRSIAKEDGLKILLQAYDDIFLGGSVNNQGQFYNLFDKIFGLVLRSDILENRLASRTNNPTGNDPADRAYLISINDRVQTNLQKVGAILVDAAQPLETVVNEILDYAYDSPRMA